MITLGPRALLSVVLCGLLFSGLGLLPLSSRAAATDRVFPPSVKAADQTDSTPPLNSSKKQKNVPKVSGKKTLSHSTKKIKKRPPKKPLPQKPLPSAESPPLDEESVPTRSDMIDVLYPTRVGEGVSNLVVGLADRVDSFFGAARSDDERSGSTLRVTPTYTFYSNRPGNFEFGVNANLKLRNLERRTKEIEETLREEFFETARAATRRTRTASGVPREGEPAKKEEPLWHTNFESRLLARPALYYSGKLRARRDFRLYGVLNHFALSAGWDSDDQWSQRLTLESDYAFADNLLFRFSNESNWFISRALFQTYHGPIIVHSLNKYNSLAYSLRLSFGTENENFHHIDTAYTINFRHGSPSNRIFLNLIPTYSYPRAESYSEVRSFEIRLEYLFGDLG